MAEANDAQMQQYASERVRVRAEQFRALVAACRDDKLAIDDIYARSVGASPWNDSRADGPPTLLNQQDMLVFNAFISDFLAHVDGDGNWAVFQSACVRPVGN